MKSSRKCVCFIGSLRASNVPIDLSYKVTVLDFIHEVTVPGLVTGAPSLLGSAFEAFHCVVVSTPLPCSVNVDAERYSMHFSAEGMLQPTTAFARCIRICVLYM